MADETRPYDPQKDATAQEPLTPNEAKLVTRLFGDPFAFPMEFKAWLRGWLEEQFPRIGSLATAAETGAAGSFVPPAGAIMDFGGDVAPSGYVLCDGSEYDRTSLVYQRLYNAIGFRFGTGSTGNMFLVPDFRERVAVGKGAMGYISAVGNHEGSPYGQRGTRHGHTASTGAVGDHTHTQARDVVYLTPDGTGYSIEGGTYVDGAQTGGAGGHAHPTYVGPGYGPNDGPAFLVVTKIISLGA